MVSLIEAVILSIIQGVTELFPISSSGHLALMQYVFGFQNLPFDVFLHLASVFAVVIVFRKEIKKILNLRHIWNIRYLLFIFISLIPAGIVGIFFRDEIETFFSNFFYLGLFFIFSGVIVYSTKFSRVRKEKVGFIDSLFIGFFQAIAVLPGISRSGMTISSGMFRGLSKRATLRFSFLASIPLIIGASFFEAGNLVFSEINYGILFISFILTFLVSLIMIKLLISIVRDEKFYLFGIYNIGLGVLVLVLWLVL